MKLMNEIECDVAGELVKKLVANGQPIEYGQDLFAVRPTNRLSVRSLSSQGNPVLCSPVIFLRAES